MNHVVLDSRGEDQYGAGGSWKPIRKDHVYRSEYFGFYSLHNACVETYG